jgi:hypothetical protein
VTIDPNILAAAASGLATLLAVGVKLLASRPRLRLHAPDTFVTLANERVSPPEDLVEPAYERLADAKGALERQTSLAKTNRWMSALLTIGQYIIGGLLASSFVQQSLRPDLVGILGLLVLISSLIYQHFRPDIQLRGAMSRSLRLRALIRSVEDDIYAIRSNSPNAPTVEAVRRRISEALSAIEASELQDLQTRESPPSEESKT